MAGEAVSPAWKYAAYICYSHKDESVASWLHRTLEQYRIPRSVAPAYGRRDVFGRSIGRVFRDREELPGGLPLTTKLYEALQHTDALIVLCTPAAAGSLYVNEEIAEFRRLGRADRIIPVIVDGEPPYCYPPQLGAVAETLNVDFRPGKDGREAGLIKVLAGLMRVEPDDLVRRERRSQRRRLAMAVSGATVFASLAATLAVVGHIAVENRRKAEASARKANDTLHRLLITRGWSALAQGRTRAAVRYALVAMSLGTDNGDNLEKYRALLAASYFEHGESEIVLDNAVAVGAFAPDGRHVLTEGCYEESDRRICLTKFRDSKTGALVSELRTSGLSFDNTVYATFSAGGNRVALVRRDGDIQIWDPWTGNIVCTILGESTSAQAVRFSDDGKSVEAVRDGTFQTFDATTCVALRSANGQGLPQRTVAISADRTVVAVHDGQAICLMAIGTGLRSKCIKNDNDFTRAILSSDKSMIVTADLSGKVKLWSVDDSKLVRTLSEAYGPVTSLLFSQDDALVAASSEDGSAIVWLSSGDGGPATFRGHEQSVRSSAFSADGRHLITTSYDGTAIIWDVAAGLERAGGGLPGNPGPGSFSAAGSERLPTKWDATYGNYIPSLSRGSLLTTAAALSADRRRIVTAHPGKTMEVRDTRTMRIITAIGDPTPSPALTYSFSSVAFSQDGTRLVTAANDDTIQIWDSYDGQLMASIGGQPNVDAVTFSSDGRWIRATSLYGNSWSSRTWSVFRLSQTWDELARDACNRLLGESGRYFDIVEIDTDPILKAEWPDPSRDVCDDVEGAARLPARKPRAGVNQRRPLTSSKPVPIDTKTLNEILKGR